MAVSSGLILAMSKRALQNAFYSTLHQSQTCMTVQTVTAHESNLSL